MRSLAVLLVVLTMLSCAVGGATAADVLDPVATTATPAPPVQVPRGTPTTAAPEQPAAPAPMATAAPPAAPGRPAMPSAPSPGAVSAPAAAATAAPAQGAAPTTAPAPPAPTVDNSTRERAIQLQPDDVIIGGLDGDTAGRFAWYTFTKGTQPIVTVDLEIHPDDILVLQGSGFRVFGPNVSRDYARGGIQKGSVPNVSGNVIGGEPGQYWVQVFNFNPGTHIGFALTVSPLGPQPGAAPAAVSPSAAAPIEQPPPPAGATGQRGRLLPGQQLHQELAYPGGRAVYTIGLHISPELTQQVGFKVFDPGRGKLYVQGGGQPGLRPNVSGNLIETTAGTYLVQLYNDAAAAVDYELTVTAGLPER